MGICGKNDPAGVPKFLGPRNGSNRENSTGDREGIERSRRRGVKSWLKTKKNIVVLQFVLVLVFWGYISVFHFSHDFEASLNLL